MQRLLYVSYAAQDFSEPAALNELAEDAIQRNKQNDITGALFYQDGCFMQLLEGSHDEVSDTFLRIKSDARHTDVEVLFLEDVEERMFPNWSMSSNWIEIKGALADTRTVIDELRQGIAEHRVADCSTALEYFFAPYFER
jgi:Sensors of blue-light using FAD